MNEDGTVVIDKNYRDDNIDAMNAAVLKHQQEKLAEATRKYEEKFARIEREMDEKAKKKAEKKAAKMKQGKVGLMKKVSNKITQIFTSEKSR